MHGTGSTSPPLTDTRDARRRLAAAARRNAEVIGSLDLDLPVKGSEWTVGDTASHLIIALRGFTDSALGDYEVWHEWEDRIPNVRTPERIAVLNRAMIAAEPKLR